MSDNNWKYAAAALAGVVLVAGAIYLKKEEFSAKDAKLVTLNNMDFVFDKVLGKKEDYRATFTINYSPKYRQQAIEVVDRIENADPDKFRYCLTEGREGDFEVFVYPQVDGEGIAVHSAKHSRTIPQDDWDKFF